MQGLGRTRADGMLIHDKLLGQKDSKMIFLPPAAAATLAAAAAAARAALPHRHRGGAWRRHGSACWHACTCCMRPPAAATHAQHACALCAARGSLLLYVCNPAWVGSVVCRMSGLGTVCLCVDVCGRVSAVRTSIMRALGEVLSDFRMHEWGAWGSRIIFVHFTNFEVLPFS